MDLPVQITLPDTTVMFDFGVRVIKKLSEMEEFPVTVSPAGKQRLYTMTTTNGYMIGLGEGSSIFSRTESDPCFKYRPMENLIVNRPDEIAKELYLIPLPPKSFVLPPRGEQDHDALMSEIGDHFVDMVTATDDEKKLHGHIKHPSPLFLYMPDDMVRGFYLAEYLGFHGIRVTFSASTPYIYLDAGRGGCFTRSVIGGAKYNIRRAMADLTLSGAINPSRRIDDAYIAQLESEWHIDEPDNLQNCAMAGQIHATDIEVEMYTINALPGVHHALPWFLL